MESNEQRRVPVTHAGILAAAALLFVVPGAFKVLKVRHTDPSSGLGDLLACLGPDALFAVGGLAILVVLERLSRGRAVARVLPAVMALSLVPVLTLSVIEHQSWAHSGTLLDWKLFLYTLRHIRELFMVIDAESTWATWLGLGLTVALAAVPWFVDRWLQGRTDLRRRITRSGWIAAGLLVLLAAATVATPASRRVQAFDRSAPFALLAGAVTGSFHRPRPEEELPAVDTTDLVKALFEKRPVTQTLPEGAPENVLVVVMESTRTDATTVYNAALPTTPTLLSLAEHGLVTDTAYIDLSHTSKALVSILCGYPARWVQTIEEAKRGGLNRPCLGHIFGSLGYASAFFQSATSKFENRPGLVHNMGYQHYAGQEAYDATGFSRANYLALEDRVMVKPILRWLDEQTEKKKRFFLTTLTGVQHHDYGLPKGFAEKPFAPKDRRHLYNRYLNTVHYADQFVGDLIQGLKDRGLYENTLVVVVGDHGEGFMEHGRKHHNDIMWEEGIRVPLIVSNPKLWRARQSVPGLRRQVDIAPTVLKALGVTFDPAWFEGRDLQGAAGHELVQASCWYDEQCLVERRGTSSIIYSYDQRPMEVYDLAADPEQKRDLLERARPEEMGGVIERADAAKRSLLARREAINRTYDNTNVDSSWILKKEPLPEHVVYANFEDHVELLGWDGPHDVDPGSFWNLTVYFRCLKPTPPGFKFLGLFALDDGRKKKADHHAAKNRYKLESCKPGDLVRDQFAIYIDPSYAAGTATFYYGVFKGKTKLAPSGTSLPVSANRVVLFRPKVNDNHEPELKTLLASAVHREEPPVAQRLDTNFGGVVTLVGAKVVSDQLRNDGTLDIDAVWKVHGTLEKGWRIFLHVDPPRGKALRENLYSAGGLLPMSRWPKGTWIVDRYSIPVPAEWRFDAKEPVKVWMGIYNDEERLEVAAPGAATVDENRVLVGTIQRVE